MLPGKARAPLTDRAPLCRAVLHSRRRRFCSRGESSSLKTTEEYLCVVCPKETGMQKVVEKPTKGEPLSIDYLIEYLPALKEVLRAQLDHRAD
jgi:hypothetical protein